MPSGKPFSSLTGVRASADQPADRCGYVTLTTALPEMADARA